MAERDEEPEVVSEVDAVSDEEEDERTIVLARHVMPSRLPVLPIRNRPFFPRMMAPIVVEDAGQKQLITEIAKSSCKYVGLVLVRPQDHEETTPSVPRHASELYTVGVAGEITQAAQVSAENPTSWRL